MSTRSRIGMVTDDGKVISIYCHWDGYVQNNGRILLESYTDPTKVKALISLGDISSLEKEPNPDPKKGGHSYDNPQNDVTVAYHRDRNEDWEDVKPRVDKDVETFIQSDVEEWGYLFKDGKWFVIDGHVGEQNQKLEPLTMDYIRDSE